MHKNTKDFTIWHQRRKANGESQIILFWRKEKYNEKGKNNNEIENLKNANGVDQKEKTCFDSCESLARNFEWRTRNKLQRCGLRREEVMKKRKRDRQRKIRAHEGSGQKKQNNLLLPVVPASKSMWQKSI